MAGEAKTLVVVAGPTASGKTDCALDLALKLDTEILSFDSRQFYREMCIGTAVPSIKVMQQVPHHFIQHISIDEPYDVARYEVAAISKLEMLFRHNDVVVAVGGSGLFIHALMYGLDKLPEADERLREELATQWKEEGPGPMLDELKASDPEYYDAVDKANPRRVIRALEVIRMTGKPFSAFRSGNKVTRPFRILPYALDIDRALLHGRIAARTDEMLNQGLVNEAEQLYPYRHLNALKTVGYQEIFSFLDGDISLSVAREKIITNTRRYARRQITWFRRDVAFEWISPEKILDRALSCL